MYGLESYPSDSVRWLLDIGGSGTSVNREKYFYYRGGLVGNSIKIIVLGY